jgi:hypothetical protein
MPRCCSSRAVPACRKGQRAAPAKEVHERLVETPATARNTEPRTAARTERPAGGWDRPSRLRRPFRVDVSESSTYVLDGAYFPVRAHRVSRTCQVRRGIALLNHPVLHFVGCTSHSRRCSARHPVRRFLLVVVSARLGTALRHLSQWPASCALAFAIVAG